MTSASAGQIDLGTDTVGMTEDEAEEYIKEMKLRKRYLLDIWS